jgi:O-antigen ligase
MTTTELLPAARDTPPTPGGEPTLRARVPLPQVAIAVGIFLLTVAVAPGWSSGLWAPKEAVLCVLAAAGLPVLVALAWRRDGEAQTGIRIASCLALTFVVVALISALTSRTPAIAMVGLYQWGTGWVFVAGIAGCFALGTRLGTNGRRLLETLLIFSGVANSIVAVLQLTVGMGRVDLPLYSGILADGLQGNPFELGAISVAALAIAEYRFNRKPRDWYLPVAIVAIGAGACGERLPLIAVVAIVAWALWQSTGARRARTGRDARNAVLFGALSVAGVIAGSLIASFSNATGGLQHAAESNSEETFGQRFMAWRQGLRAFTHHFLLGAGPGQFRSVTTALFPLSFMRAAPTTVFTDAHNIFVEYLVTTGLLGILALVAWLLVILVRARGPLVVAALVLLGIELAEPLNVAVTPVAFCALGAAMLAPRVRAAHTARAVATQNRSEETPHQFPVALRAIISAFTVVGLVAGTLFFIADGLLTRSQSEFDLAQDQPALQNATTANDILRAWPDPAAELGQIHFYLGLGDHPAQRDLSVVWAKVAALRDPTNSPQWVTVADYQLAAGQYAGALQSAAQAIIYLPFYPAALNDLGIASLALGENSAAHKWFGLSLDVTPDQPPIRAFYDGSCKLERTQIGLSLLTKHCASS